MYYVYENWFNRKCSNRVASVRQNSKTAGTSTHNNRINERINYDKLKKIAVDWNSILTAQVPKSATDELITPRKKWITKTIIISCKKKELLYNLWQKNIESENLKKEYMDYFKILNRVIEDAKVKYEWDRINKNSNDPKKDMEYN